PGVEVALDRFLRFRLVLDSPRLGELVPQLLGRRGLRLGPLSPPPEGESADRAEQEGGQPCHVTDANLSALLATPVPPYKPEAASTGRGRPQSMGRSDSGA